MKEEERYLTIKKKLHSGDYLSTQRNNKLLLEFTIAKLNGGFKRLVYKKIVTYKTVIKLCMNIKKIDQYFKQDFDTLTIEDINRFRDALNHDKVKANVTKVKWENNKSQYQVSKTDRPITYRTKCDYKKNFKLFFEFIREYVYQTEKKNLDDITRFWIVRPPSDFNEVKVEFMNDDNIHVLLNNIKNTQFKSLVQITIMSGARPCEATEIRYGKNIYKNKEGKWIIHLPKVKGVSYTKLPFEIDMFEDELYPYLDTVTKDMKTGDKLFKISEATFRKLMEHYSIKYLNHKFTPKILRKTARMVRTNAGYNETWINKLMGHAPGSRVQAHYVNYDGIKNDTIANEKLKAQQYPSLKKDYENVKLQMQAQQEQLRELKDLVLSMKAYKMRDKLKSIS